MKQHRFNTAIVYLRNKKINPSGYYRVYQYTKKINNMRFVYRELVTDRVYYAYHFKNNLLNRIRYIMCILLRGIFYLVVDSLKKEFIVIINREICPRKCFLLQRVLLTSICKKNYIIWDFDDDILDNGEITKEEWEILKKHSDSIIVSSPYLLDRLSVSDERKTSIFNTTDGDFQFTRELLEERIQSMDCEIRIVWIATASNINNLKTVISELDGYAKNVTEKIGVQVTLCCVCNESVSIKTDCLVIENVMWSRKNALNELRKAHVGIMPLIDNKYMRGKGGFKLIQYMAAGLPVVASPVGINSEIVKEYVGKLPCAGEWANAIDDICADKQRWREYACRAREEWEKRYSYKNIFEKWVDELKR